MGAVIAVQKEESEEEPEVSQTKVHHFVLLMVQPLSPDSLLYYCFDQEDSVRLQIQSVEDHTSLRPESFGNCYRFLANAIPSPTGIMLRSIRSSTNNFLLKSARAVAALSEESGSAT